MANEKDKKGQEPNPNPEGVKPDDQKSDKNEETKKFFLVRWGENLIGGAKKVKNTVNDFVHKHPYLTAGATGAIGFVGKLAWDHFTDNPDSTQTAETQVCLPPAEEEEPEHYEITFEPDEPETIPEPEKVSEE